MPPSKVRGMPTKKPPKPSAEELRKAEMQAELRQQQELRTLREELSSLGLAELRTVRDARRRSFRFLGSNPDVITAAIRELGAIEDVIQAKVKALVLTPTPDSFFRILRSQE